MRRLIAVVAGLLLVREVGLAMTSGDAYVRRDGEQWTLGTASAERVIAFEDGRLILKSLRSKLSDRELAPREGVSLLEGGGWEQLDSVTTTLKQGEIQLDISLRKDSLEVTRTFVVYPESSIVREWAMHRNVGSAPITVREPAFLSTSVRLGDPESLDFHWMTGGENNPGCWSLKTEKLRFGKPRDFDSYDPFPGTSGKHGFRPGTSTYAPWYALYARDSGDGVFIGWDYFGHWASSFALDAGGYVSAQLRIAGHRQTLEPGESMETPKAFTGLFRHDLDNAGNECLDWQYRYMWDYTRDGWFPAVRMLGYWYKGTGWGRPGVGWTGGDPDYESTFRKVFRVADLMRYTGADVYHRDWGWWDRAGDWNGPDFRTTGEYLRKHGMGQLIYAFLYTVDLESKVAREHPDWVLGNTLDMSRPEVVDFIKGQLDWFVERWGDFEWRNDSFFTAPKDGDDTPMLAQDQGFRRILKSFLDKYPGCAFQAVNGGGNYAGYDYIRYSSTIQFTDGAAGMLSNYYAALLFPPDKTNHMPDLWDPNAFDKATWNTLLCSNFDTTGDTWDPAKLEGLRMLTDIYHYLFEHGVVGRWVRVYRPEIEGDDPTMYFERLSRDGLKGVIIIKRPADGPVTMKPKGLLADETYAVSFQESDRIEKRTGKDLMVKGIALAKTPPGELIYLNLPLHPGSKLDTTPPGPPSDVGKKAAENMGYPGVEVTWKPGSDDNWVSYYEVFRDGLALDKVAKGTFYNDHSAGADPAAEYAVMTVDGAGNASELIAARGPSGKRALVVDDAEMSFTGEWSHETGLQPAHMGTISFSRQKGAVVELAFEGRKVLWFSKLGPNCGKAEVSIDGGQAEIADTYSADDIWGVCVYRKELSPGRHTIRIAAMGEHSPRASDAFVHVDGVRAER